MSADLIARFGRRFVQTARERMATVPPLDGAPVEAARKLALQLHSISGEAAMIGFRELSQLARDVMRLARDVESGAVGPGECAAAVEELGRALDELERTLP